MKNGFIRSFDLNKLFRGASKIRTETDKQTEKKTNIESEFMSVSQKQIDIQIDGEKNILYVVTFYS